MILYFLSFISSLIVVILIVMFTIYIFLCDTICRYVIQLLIEKTHAFTLVRTLMIQGIPVHQLHQVDDRAISL